MKTEQQNDRLALSDALRRYWKYLIGAAVFPSLFLCIPITSVVVLVVAFVAVFVLAVWPCIFFRVPFTFALAVMATWVVGIVLAVVTLTIIHVLTKLVAR